MTWLQFAILALAAHRVTRLITTDTILDGPRIWLLTRWPASDTVFADYRPGLMWVEASDGWMAERPSWLGDLVSCPWCIGFWISLMWVVLFAVAPQVGFWVGLPFAVSSIVGIVESTLL